jgi:hypothetical protein
MKKLFGSIIFALSLFFVAQSGYTAGAGVSKLTIRPGTLYTSTQPYISSATISFVQVNSISTTTASTQQVVMSEIKNYNYDVSFPTNNVYNLGFFTRTSTSAALTEKLVFDYLDNIVSNTYFGLKTMTAAQITVTTPTRVGLLVYDSTTNEVAISKAIAPSK